MHRCLDIPEIVLHICHNITDSRKRIDDNEDSESSDSDASDDIWGDEGTWFKNYLERLSRHDTEMVQSRSSQLFAMAQTCRQLQNPALRCLWKSLNSVAPILQSAGVELVKDNDGDLHLARRISLDQASTIKKNASLVRHIYLDNCPIARDVWANLQSILTPKATLFPNLQTVSLSKVMMDFAHLFGMPGDNLTSIITSSRVFQDTSLVEICAQSSHLTSLEVYQPLEQELLQALVDSLPNWPNLSRLRLDAPTAGVIHALSYCPKLRHILFGSIKENIFDKPSIPPETGCRTMLSMLEEIKVVRSELSRAIGFLDALPAAPNLQTVSIRFETQGTVSEEERWLTLLQSLRKYSTSLTKFHVEEETYGYPEGVVDVKLSSALLSTLATQFTALTKVKIHYTGNFDFNDDDVRGLTEALPLLEVFCFSLEAVFSEDIHYEPKTTFKCLSLFARNCPRLSRLCIMFDASYSNIPRSSESFVQGLKLAWLDVSISPGCGHPITAIKIAEYILAIFPNLQWMDWERYGAYDPEDYPKSDQAQSMMLWSKVSRVVKRKKEGRMK